ncbi:MAG TPA: hypothetical protein VJR05_11455 [Acidimicrobiia bacterium]|nr:hypothetical protein [Acidimicrobiia bacterium]
MDSNALVQLATGPMGTLVATLQPAGELGVWFQPEGDGWHHHQLADSSIGGNAPVIAVGSSQLLIIEVGDVEGRARGTGSTPVVWISNDGIRWESHQASTLATAAYLFDLVDTSRGWMAAGQLIRDSHNFVPAIFSSADGVSWELEEAGQESGAVQIAVVREEEILVGGSEDGRPALWHSRAGGRWVPWTAPGQSHGGQIAAAAWIKEEWFATGTLSESDPVAAWRSGDGQQWERLEPALGGDPTSTWTYRFGGGEQIGDRLAMAATGQRLAHENFCFAGADCFSTHTSFLVTDGRDWWELPAPPSDTSSPPAPVDGKGDLLTAGVFDGDLVLWRWPAAGDLPEFRPDPPIPALTIPRATWGQELQPDVAYAWSLNTHCGIGQLGEFNERVWHTQAMDEPLPPSLAGMGAIYGVIVLSPDETVITFTSGGTLVGVYHPEPLSETRMCM